jgi:hypothetical protein
MRFDRDYGLFAQLAPDAEPRLVQPLPAGLKVGHYVVGFGLPNQRKPDYVARVGPTYRGEFALRPFLLRSSRPPRARPGRQRAPDRHTALSSCRIRTAVTFGP